jgi:ABC-type nitrate/sulfonate/bicarbonate transport system ATPase subunit
MPVHQLDLQHIGFSYHDTGVRVLDDVSLKLERGETVGIVGPSGCGKSTLLALVAGLLQPTAGTVRLGPAEAGRHPLSMVFQQDTVLPWLPVGEHVLLFTKFRKHQLRRGITARLPLLRRYRKRDELDAWADDLLGLAHLSDWGNAYPYQLSGGMRRRLAFLTAVAPRPQVLLLDEPFSSVDEPTRIGIHQDVFRITRMLNMTTVLVTHDLAEAITLCDRVVILSQRPATVAGIFEVPFGTQRAMLELRETPEFLDLYGRLWHDLAEQIAATPREGNG